MLPLIASGILGLAGSFIGYGLDVASVLEIHQMVPRVVRAKRGEPEANWVEADDEKIAPFDLAVSFELGVGR